MIRIDPGVHALGSREFGARRAQLRTDDGRHPREGRSEDRRGAPEDLGQAGQLFLERFVQQEQVGEQRAQMNRRVQIVDERGCDDGLRDHELHGGLRRAGVGGDHVEEGEVLRTGGRQLIGEFRRSGDERRNGLVAPAHEFADL